MTSQPYVQRVRQAFQQAAAGYDQSAQLQHAVGQQLLERLLLVRMEPSIALDLGVGTGAHLPTLQDQYPVCHWLAVDTSTAMLQACQQRFSGDHVCADAMQLPFADYSLDLIYSNLMWQWLPDATAGFKEVRRVLKPGGLFMFTTFGPSSLQELRDSWAQVDDHPHVNNFIDMHDLGDQMVAAGLVESVVDQVDMAVMYNDAKALMRDLRAIGAHQVAGRQPGLTSPRALTQVVDYYQQTYGQDNAVPATYQIIHGQAWGPKIAEHVINFR